MNNGKKVFNLRKKIFKKSKYKDYDDILNDLFIPKYYNYKSCIPKCFSNKDYDKINVFNHEKYLPIYEKVLYDIEKINKQKTDKNVIFIIHPFYPLLRHCNFLIENTEYLNKYIEYEKKIIKLLKFSKRELVLVESPDSFMNYTYTFLKYGRIKHVLLTRHSEGFLLDKEHSKFLKNIQSASIVGCYRNRCISDFESELKTINYHEIESMVLSRLE